MRDLVVECRLDPVRGPLPQRFGWPGRMHEVAEVLDCWDGDDHRYVRVRGVDGGQYILRQDFAGGRWELHSYRRAP